MLLKPFRTHKLTDKLMCHVNCKHLGASIPSLHSQMSKLNVSQRQLLRKPVSILLHGEHKRIKLQFSKNPIIMDFRGLLWKNVHVNRMPV